MLAYFEQKGAGDGIDSIHERDKESVLTDPHSKIVDRPKDLESSAIIHIFNTTQFTYGMFGLEGFHYEALKDTIKWQGLRPKLYVPLLQRCMNSFLKGVKKSKT